MLETLGRYKILSVIGHGAMGVVYRAVDPVIDRPVAIKTINLSMNPDEIAEYEARFQQEIKAAGRLNHPNIVTIFDVGKNETVAYMAMELLEGNELKDILADGTRPTVVDTVDWMMQIANGLSAAHAQDIIHRDVKPSNIMVMKGGYAKITDFGIARMNASAVKTQTGLILGSPRYMSPEQVIGKPLDSRTDIFSLGVVLYETLTGSPPFDGDNVNAIMYATVNHMPIPPSVINTDVPPMLDLIVAKALSKTLDERYQTMTEFSQDLSEIKRQLTAKAPAQRMIARDQPAAVKAPSLDALGIKMGRFQKDPAEDIPLPPLKLAKKFDSFDATVRLAALTNQTAEFATYISETQKMRAYQGEIKGALAKQVAAGNSSSSPQPVSTTAAPRIKRSSIALPANDESVGNDSGGNASVPPASRSAKGASAFTALANSANAAVDTATVPMAQLEEMEIAAREHAARLAKQKEEPEAAPVERAEEHDSAAQSSATATRSRKSSAPGGSSAAPSSDVAGMSGSRLPLVIVGLLAVAAFVMLIALLVR
jgi:eukaryotic-like serine/threonine-protein kinase